MRRRRSTLSSTNAPVPAKGMLDAFREEPAT
jgi:hypothetical protein